jgi:membrane associated rhomboid family serine protease
VLLASVPSSARIALQSRSFMSLIPCPTQTIIVSFRLEHRISMSPLSSSAFRSALGIKKHNRGISQRSFSHLSSLRRRWMERQQQPLSTPRIHHHQRPLPPPPPNLHPQTWTPPTTWERANLATYSLIGLFLTIWCAHNYAEGGSVLPNGIPLPKPPGWDRISELLGFEKPRPHPPPRLQTPSATVREIKSHFSSAALSYRTSDYPPPLTLHAVLPFYASLFAHFEPLHLAINSYWTYAIAPALMMNIGIPKTFAVFVLGGMLATEIQCNADKAYALNLAPSLFKYIKAAQRDPDPNGTLGAQHVGSSGALFAMGTVRALASRQRGWRLFAVFAVGLDAVGYYMDVDTAVSYTAHLSGVVSGVILWAVWLRWTKGMRMMRLMGR